MAKSGSSKGIVPEARDALDRFKMEAASRVGVQNHLEEAKNHELSGFPGLSKIGIVGVLLHQKANFLHNFAVYLAFKRKNDGSHSVIFFL